jgi:hypothetical protein
VAAGTVLQSGDLRLVRVQLGEVGSLYLPSREAAVGKAARQSLRSGELLQRADLAEPEQGVTVTIPIRPENAPKVARGDRITVWVTTKTCRAVVILSGVAVQDVRQGTTAAFGTKAEIGVVVRLAQADAQRLVSALDLEGAAIRMGVLAAGQQPADTARDLSACSAVPR